MRSVLMDFGSTSVKYGLYDTKTNEITFSGSMPFPNRIENDDPCIFEVDINQIKQILFRILELTFDLADSIFISTQMHGYILADANGNPVTHYISWRDKRASLCLGNGSFLSRFRDTYGKNFSNTSGTSLKDNLPICGIYAIKTLNPDQFDAARTFFTLGSYLTYCLTGNNTTHISDAAASGFYHSVTCKRQMNIFKNLTIPKATANVTVAGAWNDLIVYTPVGDQQASFLGSETNGETEYLLNMGTATQICTLGDTFSDTYECRPYFHGKILCTISGLIGGRSISRYYKDGNTNFSKTLVENYTNALQYLPQKQKIVVSGGPAVYYKELITEVCNQLELPYTIGKSSNPDAIIGLKNLVEEVSI